MASSTTSVFRLFTISFFCFGNNAINFSLHDELSDVPENSKFNYLGKLTELVARLAVANKTGVECKVIRAVCASRNNFNAAHSGAAAAERYLTSVTQLIKTNK